MSATKTPTVLIIEDNDLTRSVLKMIVQGEGLTVVGASASGGYGVQQVRELKPDIVCLDVMLPDVDGLVLLQTIKEIRPQTVVLMVTASNDRNTFQTALSHGASGFIIKPFNAGTVVDTLKQAVKQLTP